MKLFSGAILGIESSCDETSASVVVGRKVKSLVVASQIEMHQKWGGVVPEAAARQHVMAILPTIQESLQCAGIEMNAISGIAVTNRPGLLGALSVGLTAAKSLAYTQKVPCVGVDHLEGHLLSILGTDSEILFPFISLVASGGHTELVLVRDLGSYTLIGQTRDDAAGEALDKGARLLGLPYPGAKLLEEMSLKGDPNRYPLPHGLARERFDMSFSGLKTAMLRLVQSESQNPDWSSADAAASLQQAVVLALLKRLQNAMEDFPCKMVSVCGGVSANRLLRKGVEDLAKLFGVSCVIPPIHLCTDNAAMIAFAGSYQLARGLDHGIGLEASAQSALFDE